jgi:hypothetical protein
MSLQRVINWLLGPSERQSELAYETEGWEVAPITLDADVVTSVLKGRRLRRRRAMFRGFKSPPGRF